MNILFDWVIFQSEEEMASKCAEMGWDSFQCTLAYGLVGASQLMLWAIPILIALLALVWTFGLGRGTTSSCGPK